MKSALILRYSEFLEQSATPEQLQQAAIALKILSRHVKDIEVSDDQIANGDSLVEKHLTDLSHVFKSDKDYPSLKKNPKE